MVIIKKELDDVNAALKSEAAAAKPAWKTIKEIEAKRGRKRQAMEKARAQKEQLE